MNEIKITTVKTKQDRRKFLTFPWIVYKDDPLWVPPLIPERAKTIDPQQGTFLQRGGGDFFIAWRDGKPVGTICAAEDKPTNEVRDKNECVFGFFDYIEAYEVFCALVERVKEWARERGLTDLLGPYNLDYEDGYGVLIKGRDRPPALMCGHTPTYYQGFMERYGFIPAKAPNLAFALDLEESPQLQRVSRIADRLRQRGTITVRGADFDDAENEIDRIHKLLLKALAWSENRIPWRRDALAAIVEPFQAIGDPDLILFAEVDGEAVGWFPAVPNLNEAFIHVNGLRYPWDYLKLLWHMRRQPESIAIKSAVVLPEWHKQGVAVLLFDEMAKRARAKGYKWADNSITSEDNPDTVDLAATMGAVEYKRWQVYNLPVD
jgi:GNAT superfamily N-acetyltransferase